MNDRFVDLAIRIGELNDTSLIAYKIGTARHITIGAISYFEKSGEPQQPEELVHYNCIVYTELSTGNECHIAILNHL
jgi:hypothetical protein